MYNPWTSKRTPSSRQIGLLFNKITKHVKLIDPNSEQLLDLINRYECIIARYHAKKKKKC